MTAVARWYKLVQLQMKFTMLLASFFSKALHGFKIIRMIRMQ